MSDPQRLYADWMSTSVMRWRGNEKKRKPIGRKHDREQVRIFHDDDVTESHMISRRISGEVVRDMDTLQIYKRSDATDSITSTGNISPKRLRVVNYKWILHLILYRYDISEDMYRSELRRKCVGNIACVRYILIRESTFSSQMTHKRSVEGYIWLKVFF